MNEFIDKFWPAIAWFIAIVLILAFFRGAATLRDAKDRRVFMRDYKKTPNKYGKIEKPGRGRRPGSLF